MPIPHDFPPGAGDLRPFTRDTRLCRFLVLPTALLRWGLSPGAVLVYALLLDRAKLSQRSGWTDKRGWVYTVFPIQALCQALGRDHPETLDPGTGSPGVDLPHRPPARGHGMDLSPGAQILRGGGGDGGAPPSPRPLGGTRLGPPPRAAIQRRHPPDVPDPHGGVIHTPGRIRPRSGFGGPQAKSGRGRGRIWPPIQVT